MLIPNSGYYEKYLDCFSSHAGRYFRVHFFPYMRSLSVMARFQFYELSNPEGARKHCQSRISCIEEYRNFFDERRIEMPHSISTSLEKYQRKAETDMMEYSK
ncbi:MAG: hypothetical protein LBK58_03080 [Prevotellaceae bacterium]|nr:hypothetical protein [Prevotellaceae bacterium]